MCESTLQQLYNDVSLKVIKKINRMEIKNLRIVACPLLIIFSDENTSHFIVRGDAIAM